MNASMKLAGLWTNLKVVKDKFDNEIIPVGGCLDVEDPELRIALKDLSAKIQNYFKRFILIAIKTNKQ